MAFKFERKSGFTKPGSGNTSLTGKPGDSLGGGAGSGSNRPVLLSASTPTPYVTNTGMYLETPTSFLSLTGKATPKPVTLEVAANTSAWGRRSELEGAVIYADAELGSNRPDPIDDPGSGGTGGGSGGGGTGGGSGGEDPFSQLVDLASGLLGGGGGSISVPDSGAYVVPGQAGGVSPLALVALVGGLGAVGYYLYQKQKGG